MDYNELIKRLRDCVSYTVEDCAGCPYRGGYKGDYCMNGLISEAADAIEELLHKLCDWCGVCPENRRKPHDCEIIFPNAPVPEVWIEPPKEES